MVRGHRSDGPPGDRTRAEPQIHGPWPVGPKLLTAADHTGLTVARVSGQRRCWVCLACRSEGSSDQGEILNKLLRLSLTLLAFLMVLVASPLSAQSAHGRARGRGHRARVEVTAPRAPRVRVRTPRAPRARVEVTAPRAPRVRVRAPRAPHVRVTAPPPRVSVRVRAPRVRVTAPAPATVVVTAPRPPMVVVRPPPPVVVTPPSPPSVTVTLPSPPSVTITH